MLRSQTEVCCFPQGKAICTYIRKYFKNELGLGSFSEVLTYGHVPVNSHHIPGCSLLNVCTACVQSGICFY